MASICETRDDCLLGEGTRISRQSARLVGRASLAGRGRASVLPCRFHAAQAFVFESTGKVAKSHKGLQTEFARLVKDDLRFNMELRGFLGRAYNFKTIADYETSGSPVSLERAAEANQTGRRFVECVVASLLWSNRHSPNAEPKP
jgi:uncharacterized protein (UPF0332 family)